MQHAVTRGADKREVPVCEWGVRLVLWVYAHLGRRVAVWLVGGIMLFAYPFLRKARCASREYRQRWQEYTGRPCCSGFSHLYTFSCTMADRLACRDKLFGMEQVAVQTPAEYEELCARYRRREGVFCIASHLGCFDMLRVLFEDPAQGQGGEIHVFMDTAATVQFARMQSRYATRSDLFVHSVEELGLALSMEMAQKLDDGAIVVMAGDRVWRTGAKANIRVPFFGREADFPRGCFKWAAALQCPVYTFCLTEQGAHYDLCVRCLSADGAASAQNLAEAYVRTLEEWCILYPQNWFNFYSFWG